MNSLTKLLLALSLFITVACTSTPLKMATPPLAANEKAIGPAEGSATGIMLFNFIPIGQNERFNDAYAAALESSGGTRLIDVEISERWFWAYVLNGYIFTVKGTAVGPK